jgi:hypothetical protein
MSRVLKRPMFKMGGSTSGGITSGMKRARYQEGEKVTTEDILREYGPAPRSSNVYDFLIDFGLNIASMPPQGNIISTAAAAAREPFSRFTEGKSKGEQLAYAMRAQAADSARRQNLAYDEMKMKEKIAKMNIAAQQKDGFLKKDNRLGFIMDKAKRYSETGNALQQTYPEGMAEWEAIKNYDAVPVQLSPLEETKDGYRVKFEDFKPEDQFTIFWDPITRTYFVPTFKEDGSFDPEATEATTTEGKYGDPENNYMDINLQKLNNILQNKKSAEIIQSGGEETNENDLTKLVVENKLEEGMVHPTVDGTQEGEISDEYVLTYAKENKIPLLNKPDGSSDNYKGMGGKDYWSKFPMNFIALKNSMKNENAPSIFKDTAAKTDKRKKDRAFKYFSRKRGDKTLYELIQEGKLTMSPIHAPYLKEYEKSLQTVVAEAN